MIKWYFHVLCSANVTNYIQVIIDKIYLKFWINLKDDVLLRTSHSLNLLLGLFHDNNGVLRDIRFNSIICLYQDYKTIWLIGKVEAWGIEACK